ncbi:Nucleolar pre-ribosomal-associated protein 2 [Fusarium oxysporum f. sp. albedinis]|nr:Nucleolar pre-ribosomal-associated protein 2 [Fusarium oxysporum f. sp. albedinis]
MRTSTHSPPGTVSSEMILNSAEMPMAGCTFHSLAGKSRYRCERLALILGAFHSSYATQHTIGAFILGIDINECRAMLEVSELLVIWV